MRFYFRSCSLKHLRWNKLSLHVEKNRRINGWHWPLWLCCTGSTVRGEWGTAHIRANLHRRPGHAHEDWDDDARHIQPGLQAESRAHRAGVGGASGTKSWEKSRTRQWNRVSQDRPRPQGRTDSRIIWLLLCHDPFLGFPDPKNVNCPPLLFTPLNVWIPNPVILLPFYLKLKNSMLQMVESTFTPQQYITFWSNYIWFKFSATVYLYSTCQEEISYLPLCICATAVAFINTVKDITSTSPPLFDFFPVATHGIAVKKTPGYCKQGHL